MDTSQKMIILWAALVVLFLVFEMVSTAFVALYVSVGAGAALIAAVAGGGVPMQVAAFAVVGLTALVLTRPIIMRKLQQESIPSNVHWLVGKRGIVTIEIDPDAGAGQIRVGTEFWTAASPEGNGSIPVSAKVEVMAVEGVTALVQRVDAASADR